MNREEFSQLTDTEKYWYLKGYLHSLIDSISMDMKVPKRVVTMWVVDRLQSVVRL